MKKLMMLAAAMTIVGGAYAQDYYDYKASVKHPDLKTVTVVVSGVSTKVTTKYIKTTSLYGYVVAECASCATGNETTLQRTAGDGWGYLVVANTTKKAPKILPIDLLAKAWSPTGKLTAKTWDAEGYMFAGDGKKQVPWIDSVSADDPDDPTAYHFSGMLFGSTIELLSSWNKADTYGEFRDTWLEAAGFGKALADSFGDDCTIGSTCLALDSLSGSVIGGMWLCADPGEVICSPWYHTTDVVSGTWSIKHTTKVSPVALVAPEVPFVSLIGYTPQDADVSAAVNGAIKKFGAVSFNTVVTAGIRDHYQEGYLSTVFNACGDSYETLYNDR